MKKFLALIMASMMVASLAVGCGSTEEETTDAPTDAPTDAATDEKEISGTLVVYALDSAYGSQMWEDVVAAFNNYYPDVTVDLTVDAKLEAILDPQIQAEQYPDVVHLATGRDDGLTEEVRDNLLLRDLTDMLNTTIAGESDTPADKIIDGFTDTVLTNPYSDGKTYMAPMFYSPCGLFYNANVLEKNGWTFPTTWDEMWELGDKALEKGIYLFTYPTAGYFDAFMYALIYSQGGADMFNAAMNYEGWDTDEMKEVLETVAKLADYTEPTTVGNANNSSFSLNQQLVIDGKAICMPNGTWVVNEMIDSTPEDFVWGFAAVPAVNPDNAPVSFSWIEQMWSFKDCANPDAADAFMAFCYSDEAAAIFAASGAIQPIEGVADTLEGDSKLFYSVYDNGASSVQGGFAATEVIDNLNVQDVFFNNMDEIVGGTLTVDEWQAEIVDACNQWKEVLL